MPVPPGTLRPQEINDLSYKIVKEGVILSWSVPYRNLDGSPIDKIKEFRLFKKELSPDAACKECPPNYGTPVVIKYDRKPEPGKRMVYEDTTLKEGYFYVYQVKTVKNLFNVSDFSNKVTFYFHSPPKPPLNLTTKVFEEGVQVSWLPPKEFESGKEIQGQLEYDVFRRFDKESDWELVASGVDDTGIFDNIRRVFKIVEYRVRAVFNFHGTAIESEFSRIALAKARGRQDIPGPRLKGLKNTEEGIKIIFSPSRRPGIKGYFIYRIDENGLIVQLNQNPFPHTVFIDRSVLLPGKYTYWVTAIDDSIPPNESRPSNKVSIIIK